MLGRKLILSISFFCGSMAILLSSFQTSFYWFLFYYTIAGSCFYSNMQVSTILFNEITDSKLGILGTVMMLIVWPLAEMINIVIIKSITNWKLIFKYVIGIPSLIYFLSYHWIQESPRYLFKKGKANEAQNILIEIAAINKRELEFNKLDIQF